MIRKFKEEDTAPVCELSRKTFDKFCGEDYFNKEGVTKTLDAFDPKKNTHLQEDFKKTNIFYIAEKDGKIIGMVRGTSKKLHSLFVDSSQQSKGLGRQLMEKFEKDAKKEGSKEIEIQSSLYATPFYEKIGYKKISGIENFQGLKVYHMKKELR